MELKNSTGLINSKINKRKIGIKADRYLKQENLYLNYQFYEIGSTLRKI